MTTGPGTHRSLTASSTASPTGNSPTPTRTLTRLKEIATTRSTRGGRTQRPMAKRRKSSSSRARGRGEVRLMTDEEFLPYYMKFRDAIKRWSLRRAGYDYDIAQDLEQVCFLALAQFDPSKPERITATLVRLRLNSRMTRWWHTEQSHHTWRNPTRSRGRHG